MSMFDIDCFTDDQKRFLSEIVRDLGGPGATGNLLYVIELLIYTFRPDGKMSGFADAPDLKNDLEVCLAALHYLKVKEATGT
jgi:hypothetical protein